MTAALVFNVNGSSSFSPFIKRFFVDSIATKLALEIILGHFDSNGVLIPQIVE